MTSARVRVLIVDDEPLARETLRLLMRRDAEVEIVGECGSGRDAVDTIDRLAPDLVFLDVQMPELDGFQTLARLGLAAERRPIVVFVTAYDRYALKAFDAHALDYLVKPFTDERFYAALDRAKAHVRQRAFGEVGERMLSLLRAQGFGEPPRSDAASTAAARGSEIDAAAAGGGASGVASRSDAGVGVGGRGAGMPTGATAGNNASDVAPRPDADSVGVDSAAGTPTGVTAGAGASDVAPRPAAAGIGGGSAAGKPTGATAGNSASDVARRPDTDGVEIDRASGTPTGATAGAGAPGPLADDAASVERATSVAPPAAGAEAADVARGTGAPAPASVAGQADAGAPPAHGGMNAERAATAQSPAAVSPAAGGAGSASGSPSGTPSQGGAAGTTGAAATGGTSATGHIDDAPATAAHGDTKRDRDGGAELPAPAASGAAGSMPATAAPSPVPVAPRRPLDRIPVKADGRVTFVRTADIDWIEACDDYVRLHAGGTSHELRQPLKDLAARLDPRRFVRIHRSAIVNLDRVQELQPHFHGSYVVVLRNGASLPISRARREELRAALGLGDLLP